MTISVVIATYGEEEWAELAKTRALESLIGQSPDQFVLSHWDYPPGEKIGPARNRGAAQATGDWLVFLDADDELEPGFFRQMRRAIANYNPERHAVLFTPAVRYVRKGKPGKTRFPPKLGTLKDDNHLIVGTMIERTLFHEVGGFGDYPHGFEDWSLWAKAWKAGARVIQVPHAVYRAHVNPQSKHRQGWRNRSWQVAMHERVRRELFPEDYA